MNPRFRSRWRTLRPLTLLAGLLLATPAAGQDAAQFADPAPRVTVVSGWGVYRHVTFQDSTNFVQFSVPLTLQARLTQNVSAVVYGAFARTQVRPVAGTGEVRTLSGPTDTRVKLFYHAGGTVFSAGASLPTGKHSLLPAEELVASAAATDVFGFRVRRLGEGPAAEAGLTHAVVLGPNGALAVGLAYMYRGSYKPSAGSDAKYRPGGELSASAGFDYNTAARLLRIDVAARMYGQDQSEGVPAFKQGTALVFEERWVERGGSGALRNDLFLRQVLKSASDYYGGTVAAEVSGSTENGSSFGVEERLELQAGGGLRLAALAEGNVYGKNPAFDSAHLLGFGGEICYQPTAHAQVRLLGKLLTGAADPGGLKLSGYDLGLAFRLVP